MPTNLMDANAQWRTRPDDERFLTLEALHLASLASAARSSTQLATLDDLKFHASSSGDKSSLVMSAFGGPPMGFTHWSFGQICAAAGIPAGFARSIPHIEFAAATMNYGLSFMSGNSKQSRNEGLLLVENDAAGNIVTASTSPTYGRIWNCEATQALMDLNRDGRWVVPAASYQHADPLRATTIYGSAHNIFVFLVDPSTPIEIVRPDGKIETLHRGFMCWNSQVGAAQFGLKMFLYRFVCDNRIVWGAEDVETILIRHTKNGPERFAREAAPRLQEYANSSTEKVVGTMKRAMSKEISSDNTRVVEWLRSKGYGKTEAVKIIEVAIQEEGQAASVWDLVQGATAIARSIPHADDRVAAEVRASSLLKGL